MAKKNNKREDMVTNVTTDETPIETEDSTLKEPVIKEVAQKVAKPAAGALGVGSAISIEQSSYKNLIGLQATIVDVTDAGYIVDVNGAKYQFSESDIKKV